MSSEDTDLTRNTNGCNVRLWRRMFDSEHKVAPIGTNELRTLQLQARLLMYLIYSLLYVLALVLSLPYWLIGMARAGKYRAGLAERFGAVPSRLKPPQSHEKSIWIHAVSVGEVLAVSDLITGLKAAFPERRFYVSTTTLTGQILARQRFGEESVFYVPLDLPFAVNRYLKVLTPKMLILAETEFWPNMLRLAKQSGAQIVVVNGRISDRSLPGYRRFRFLLREVLQKVRLFLAQTEVDRERLISIGAPADRVRVAGNLKLDVKTPSDSALSRALRQHIALNQKV